jgi:aerobic-type carbon monoxide dehydrogenase small subunit (CoxS/CutS family)
LTEPAAPDVVRFVVDGAEVEVPAGGSLLDALREQLGVRTVKDGCSPQGQCGCCTVWVDGQPRVACVTPVARVRGRSVTTVAGLDDSDRWAAAFCDTGASQCGFCTPGIVMRVAALDAARREDPAAIRQSLLAHLCRCTGWNPIVDAVLAVAAPPPAVPVPVSRDLAAAARRAEIEGGAPQAVGPHVALGRGGFADDTAPPDALVGVRGVDGEWVIGETLAAARAASGKVQGRRTTAPIDWPLDVPSGDWARTLRTTWVEPAYLEPDASWCQPGGEPMTSRGNGGAFGGKESEELGRAARRLADAHGRAVRLLSTREDVVRLGPKRPPIAAGLRHDGTGVLRVARTPGIVDAIAAVAPGLDVVEADVVGPPTSTSIRGAGWAEALVLLGSLTDSTHVTAPGGGTASAVIDADGSIRVTVRCGDPLDEVVLRSYCVGAAHMALGWVTSEGIAVGHDGVPHDLTMRSFGVLRAVDTPAIDVVVEPDPGAPVNGSDAVFAAVALAAWRRTGFAPRWPTGR